MEFTPRLILLIYLFRLICGLTLTTLLFPDEWWQFSEPSYVKITGTGYFTWDWQAGIRSVFPIVPMLCLVKVVKFIGIGEDFMMKNGSVILMAAWITLTDVYTVKLAGKFFGPNVRPYALIFTLSSAFHASRSIRSLSNNIEMSLSTVAFYYLDNYETALFLIGFSCLTRITALIFWFVPLTIKFIQGTRVQMFISTPLIISSILGIGTVFDSIFYGKITLTWWNFFYWNILKGISTNYGEESFFYHFKTTLPLMINTFMVYVIYGTWRALKMRKCVLILVTCASFLTLSSLQKHKETRFLAPIHPFLLLLGAFGAQQVDLIKSKYKLLKVMKTFLLVGAITSQLVIFMFYGRAHYSGAYEIVDHLRNIIDKSSKNTNHSVFFLTPCHVTPYQGYLNRNNISLDFIKCHPESVDSLMPPEESESRDNFQNDPVNFVQTRIVDAGISHIIIFEGELPKYWSLFKDSYVICARSSKPLLPRIGGSRARGDALILCKE